jgi:hypothetical protein
MPQVPNNEMVARQLDKTVSYIPMSSTSSSACSSSSSSSSAFCPSKLASSFVSVSTSSSVSSDAPSSCPSDNGSLSSDYDSLVSSRNAVHNSLGGVVDEFVDEENLQMDELASFRDSMAVFESMHEMLPVEADVCGDGFDDIPDPPESPV